MLEIIIYNPQGVWTRGIYCRDGRPASKLIARYRALGYGVVARAYMPEDC